MILQTTDSWGKKVVGVVTYTIESFFMIYLSIRATLSDQAQGFRTIISVISAQVYFTGYQALPLISGLALACGTAVILQATSSVAFFGGTSSLGSLMVMIAIRELGPLLTALIVIARSGTAVASELGNMKVNREVEALESMGINPLSYIVFPRLWGGVISVLCLAIYFVVIAILGGYLTTIFFQDIDFRFYLSLILNAFTTGDAIMFFLKNTFGGGMIFVIACRQGLSVESSSHEVPQVTTLAVVRSILYVVGFNISVSILFYLDQLRRLGVL